MTLMMLWIGSGPGCGAHTLGNPVPSGSSGETAGNGGFGIPVGGTSGSSSLPAGLSTQNGNVVAADGTVVTFHGVTWYGFENGSGLLQGLNQGTDNIAGDFATQVYRLQALGFNTVRLPFSFNDVLNLTPSSAAQTCTMQSTAALKAALTDPNLAVSGNPNFPAMIYPQVPTPTQCNEYLPRTTMAERFAFVVEFLALNHMYVVLTNHVATDATYQNPNQWLRNWQILMQKVLVDSHTQDQIIIDPVDEPDSVGLLWDDPNATANPNGIISLFNLQLGAMDNINVQSPNTLFWVEGTGQAGIGANPGDGFATGETVINANNLSNPNHFFATLFNKRYINRVVLAPHVAPPSISGHTTDTGMALWNRLNTSFGAYNRQGLTLGATTHVFPVVIVMGSQLGAGDNTMMSDLANYMLRINGSNDALHNQMTSWVWQAWNTNNAGTGGIEDSSWKGIVWNKIEYLGGLTPTYPNSLGLRPWFAP